MSREAHERLRSVVRATPATERHGLLDALADVLRETALTYPSRRRARCSCGIQLHPTTRTPNPEVLELDYCVGWQEGDLDLNESDWPTAHIYGDTDREPVAIAFMCPGCRRLYNLPTHIPLHYS